MEKYDYIIIGTGIGGLTTGALLAQSGKKVAIFEQHFLPGGYGHTFVRDGFSFCPGWHYVWNCGKDQPVFNTLKKLGLEKEVTFEQLDPEGFDRIVSTGIDYKIGNGFDKEYARLAKMFPDNDKKIKKYFHILEKLFEQMFDLSFAIIHNPFRYSYIIRYYNWTLQKLFDHLGFPEELQCILAGQGSIFFLPPKELSLLAHAGGVASYNSGAYYPTDNFETVIQSLLGKIKDQEGCAVHLSTEVVKINLDNNHKKVVSIETKQGETFTADNFIFNGDPQLSMNLIGKEHFPKKYQKKLGYNYSTGALSVFMGLKGLDIEKYIGKENIFYYSEPNINDVYKEHFAKGIPERLHFFCNAPSLRSDTLCPEGCHQLVAIAPCNYEYFADLKSKDRALYDNAKEKYADKIISTIEEKLIPDLKSHIISKTIGSPTTSKHFVFAPKGNCYSSPLDPKHVNFHRINYKSPFENMFYIGAGTSLPGFATIIRASSILYEKLTGDKVY